MYYAQSSHCTYPKPDNGLGNKSFTYARDPSLQMQHCTLPQTMRMLRGSQLHSFAPRRLLQTRARDVTVTRLVLHYDKATVVRH